MQRLVVERHGVSLIGDTLRSGPTALLLHAGGERRTVWHPVMRDLAAAGLGSVAFDQRGHGESGGSRDDGVIAFGEDAARMIDEVAASVVVGASLGGFAAMLALARPEVRTGVAGFILVDVLPDPDPERVRAFLSARGMADAALVDDILGRAEEMRCAIATLDLPVLLVRAGADSTISDSEVARLTRLVPHLESVTVPEAGHLIARDCPDRLASIIRGFMQSDAVRHRMASGDLPGPAELA